MDLNETLKVALIFGPTKLVQIFKDCFRLLLFKFTAIVVSVGSESIFVLIKL